MVAIRIEFSDVENPRDSPGQGVTVVMLYSRRYEYNREEETYLTFTK